MTMKYEMADLKEPSMFLQEASMLLFTIGLAVFLTPSDFAGFLSNLALAVGYDCPLTLSTSHLHHLHFSWYSHDGFIVFRKKVCSYFK